MSRFAKIICTLLLIFITSFHASAQEQKTSENNTASQPPAAEQQAAPSPVSDLIANWDGTLASSEQALSRQGIKDDELIVKANETATIRMEARQQELKIEPELKRLKAQLDQLGPAPKDGEPAEAPAIAAERKELETKFTNLDGQLKTIRLIIVRSAQIESQITDIRRQHFVTKLSQRYRSLFDIKLWQNYWKGITGFWRGLNLLITDSVKAMGAKISENPVSLATAIAGIFLTLYIATFLRRKFGERQEKIAYLAKNFPMGNDARILIAAFMFIRNGVIPALALAAIYVLIQSPGILSDRLDSLVYDVFFVAICALLALVIARLYLAPRNSSRRFIAMSDETSTKVNKIVIWGILITAVLWLYNRIAIALVSPFDVSISLRALMALTCFVAIAMALSTIAAGRKHATSPIPLNRNFLRWGYVKPLFWLGCIAGAVSLVAGYLAFAFFLAWQLLIGALVFAILWLIIEFIDIYRNRYLNVDNGKWRQKTTTFGFSQQAMLQSGVFGFGMLKLLVIFSAAIIFLISWGYRTDDWVGTAGSVFSGFRVGGLNISISAIFISVLLFLTGYIVTRAIQRWLRQQFLPTTNLDPGLRNSIATVFGYAGIVIAVLLSVSAAGIDLSNIAIIAGALSVGIGFGLQSIVNNFTSGLILLAERPIKAGDWIITSGGQGIVTKTSVRSTEIETFDGATVIIPNSTLITEAVTNWTHHDKRGRIIITIGVGYDSDPQQVKDLLLECAKENRLVLKKPGPKVYFVDFGADALMFELRGYLSDINNSLSVKSDLRFSIITALRKANIEIPYPQRDIHIRSVPDQAIQLEQKAKTTSRRKT